jgi:hypothetical protein
LPGISAPILNYILLLYKVCSIVHVGSRVK